ncbi:hypothetical protein V6N13_130003 [Hibiscus sabdariffa]
MLYSSLAPYHHKDLDDVNDLWFGGDPLNMSPSFYRAATLGSPRCLVRGCYSMDCSPLYFDMFSDRLLPYHLFHPFLSSRVNGLWLMPNVFPIPI